MKRIKSKKSAVLLAASIILSLTFAGCGDLSVEIDGAEDETPATENTASAGKSSSAAASSGNSTDNNNSSSSSGENNSSGNSGSSGSSGNSSTSGTSGNNGNSSTSGNSGTSGDVKSGYTLVWSDEFTSADSDKTPLSSKWGYDVGRGQSTNTDGTNPNNWAWGNNELQWYSDNDPDNTYVSDGTLKIKAIKESAASDATWTSGRIVTRNIQAFKYGYIEMKAKIPADAGVWPAFWMLDNDIYDNPNPETWPGSGEIDIMESSVSVWGKDVVYGTLHCQAGSGGSPIITQATTVNYSDNNFHTYAVDWTDKKITWYYDDVAFMSYTPTDYGNDRWPFCDDFYIILNLAVGGNLGGTVPDSLTESTMEVDYVRVYQKDSSDSSGEDSSTSKYQAVIYGTDETVTNPLGNLTTWGSSGMSLTADTKFSTACKKVSFTTMSDWNNSCGGVDVSPAVAYKANSTLKFKVYAPNDFYFKINETNYTCSASTSEEWKEFSVDLGSSSGSLSSIGLVSEVLQDVYISAIYVE